MIMMEYLDILNVGAEADPAEPNSGGYMEVFTEQW